MWQYPNPDWTIYAPHFSILLAVVKMHCLYANAVVQPSVQHVSCYMAWKTKDHTWCRYCHLCINAPMWREKRWLQGIIDPQSYESPLSNDTKKVPVALHLTSQWRLNDVRVTKNWIWILDENRPNFKFLPKILGPRNMRFWWVLG